MLNHSTSLVPSVARDPKLFVELARQFCRDRHTSSWRMPAYHNSTLGEPWYQENAAPLTNVAPTAYATSVSVNNPGDSLIVFLRTGRHVLRGLRGDPEHHAGPFL